MITRVDSEARERDSLAPYAARAAESRGRQHEEPEHPLRTAFQRDRDRIVHSTAFRRLEYKTQVFVNHEGDHFRTRLTHTLEVAQIARTVARALACNEDLTESIALSHDLGHTAFGHAGEDAVAELMADHGGFEHNRHGLRIVDLLERPYPDFRGLNLSFEVRRAILKYPSPDLPEDAEFQVPGPPLLEAEIVDASDSIAYVHHDLDDGLRAGILDAAALLRDVELWAEAAGDVDRRWPALREDDPHVRWRAIIRALIDRTVTDLVEQTRESLASGDLRVTHGEELARKKGDLLSYLYQNFYRSHLVQRMALKAKRILQELWRTYVDAPETLPPKWQRWVDTEGVHRAVCDYVAGMTDRMANDEFAHLSSPYH